MAAQALTYDSLRRSIANGQIAPMYLLHGAEGYYTDCLVKSLEETVPEEDRDFGLTVVYAPQTEPGAIIDLCRQLPMMTDSQLVIVKEAQNVRADYLEKLVRYALSPTPSTVLVIAARGADVKARKLTDAISKSGGIVFQSRPVYESQIPALISAYIKEKGLSADPKAMEMLRDHIGTDLSRLYNEIDKLVSILGTGAMVTPEAVERNIGVSKDYNSYELLDAVAARDLPRIYRIADYFAANPRQNPLPPVTSTLFGFFADMLVAYYTPDKSERSLMEALGMRNSLGLRRLRTGMANYDAFQTVANIHELRRFDGMTKGVGSRQDGYDLLRDVLFRIVTTTGR